MKYYNRRMQMLKKMHCDGSRIQNNDITIFVKYAASVCSVDIGINYDAHYIWSYVIA